MRFTLDADGKVIDVNQPAEVADGNLSQCAPERRRPRSQNRLRETTVTSLTDVIIWLSIAYALLGVLLLVVCVLKIPGP